MTTDKKAAALKAVTKAEKARDKEIARHTDALAQRKKELADAIRAAGDAGNKMQAVADHLGVSRQRLYKLLED